MNFSTLTSLLAQYEPGAQEAPSPIVFVVQIAIAILLIAALWQIFSKAGKPGWAAIIPIFNTIVLLQVAGRPWWWIFLLLIPFVNIVIFFIVMIDLAKSFGQGVLFGIGLALLGVIFFPILGFGGAQYQGRAAAA